MNQEQESSLDDIFGKIDKTLAAYREPSREMPEPRTESPLQAKIASEPQKDTIQSFRDFPERHRRQIALTGDEWHEAYRKCLAVANVGGVIALIGNRGAGKTQMAWQIAQNMTGEFTIHGKQDGFSTSQCRPAIYRTAMDMFLELRSSYSPKADKTEYQLFKEYDNAALLVIDEITVRTGSEFEDMKVTAIMDKRYQSMRSTILIGNMTADELMERLGKSVTSRISETGIIIECNWPSFRTNKQK